MKKFFAIFVCLSFGITASGNEIWITFPDVTTRDKLSKSVEAHRARIHESDFISSFEAQISRPVSSEILGNILKLEDEAQTSTLNGHFATAADLYKKLLSKLEPIPNVSGVERITLSTFIHLAELHDLLKDGESDRAWKQAHAWFPKSLPLTGEFTPKTIRRFNEVTRPFTANLEVNAPLESAVYVDGHLLGASENRFRKKLEIGFHQVSVLTPGSEWMVKTIRILPNENRDLNFRPEPVVEGTCDDPHYTGSTLPHKTKLLVVFADCERVFYEKAWFNVNGRQLESLAPGPSAPSLMTETLSAPEEKSWWTNLSRSKWFWTGVGIVAVGAVALAVQNQGQTTTFTPTNSIK